MNRYNSYKDSGVEWIGEIPNHWKQIKLKHQYKIQKGRIPKNLYDEPKVGLIPYLSMDVLRGSNSYNFAELNDGVLVKKDEILILWDGSNSGEILKVEIDGILSSTMGVLNTVNCYLNKDFSFYQLKYNEAEIRNNTNGMGIPHVDGGYVRNLPVFVPPLQEQEQIVTYLDKKTAIVDALITSKEEKINLLKENRTALINHAITKGLDTNVELKDSGVEWIGEIPAHWDKPKMKYICEFILDGTHGSFERVDSGFRLLSVRNIIDNKFVFRDDDSMVSKIDFETISRKFLIKIDDIQLAIVGATLGKVAIVEDLPEKFVTQRSIATIRVNSTKSDSRFLYFFLLSGKFQSYLWLNAGFSAQPGVYLGTLQNCTIALPDLKTQIEIIEYLLIHTQEIDELISLELKKIETLKEYRQALISEVVTGKIKVVK